MELWELVARESCRDTLAQYTHAGDRYLLDEFACSLLRGRRARDPRQRPRAGTAGHHGAFGGGTAALRARQAARTQAPGTTRRVVRHNVTNIRFESVSPSEATVASYFTVFTEVGPDHMGRYRDRLVPVGDRWLIAHRFVSVDWHAPDSVYRSTEPG